MKEERDRREKIISTLPLLLCEDMMSNHKPHERCNGVVVEQIIIINKNDHHKKCLTRNFIFLLLLQFPFKVICKLTLVQAILFI
jgi:hypothetical protein